MFRASNGQVIIALLALVAGCGGRFSTAGNPEPAKVIAYGAPNGQASYQDETSSVATLQAGEARKLRFDKATDEELKKTEVDVSGGTFGRPVQLRAAQAGSLVTPRALELLKLDYAEPASLTLHLSTRPAGTRFGVPVIVSMPLRAAPQLALEATSTLAAIGVVQRNGVVLFLTIPTADITVTGGFASFAVTDPGSYQLIYTEALVAGKGEATVGSVAVLPGAEESPELLIGSNPTAVKAAAAGPSKVCAKWGPSRRVGDLDHSLVGESSGMVFSKRFGNRLYHINDGPDPAFFVSDLDGSHLKKVAVKGFTPLDIEFLAYGPCRDGRFCLFLGDTGDNKLDRTTVQIAAVEELADFPAEVEALNIVAFAAPKRDIEAGAVHPVTGDIYMITKLNPAEAAERVDVATRTVKDASLSIYMVRRAVLEAPAKPEQLPSFGLKQNFEFLAAQTTPTADPTKFSPDWLVFDPTSASPSPLLGKFVTDMAFAPDGKSFLIMTYSNIVEMGIDLDGEAFGFLGLKLGTDYDIRTVKQLPQQESVTYLDEGKALLYATEFVPGKSDSVPIMRMDCLQPR